jgi:hypothetical protein
MHSNSGIRLFLCASLLLIMGTGVASAQGQKITRENREASESERDNPRERAQWFMRGRTVNGKPAPELLHKAYQQKLNNRRLHEAARLSQARSSASQTSIGEAGAAQSVNPNFVQTTGGPSWVPLGPAPSGTASVGDQDQDYGPAIGRSTVVVVDQSDTNGNTVYLGGAAGGLWKSTNAANTNIQNCNTVSVSQAPYCAPSVTWTPLLDQQPTLTVGAMAIRPGNPQWLVVGTGEANNSADSYYGLGFLVSQDGGATWTLASTAKSSDGSSTIDLHGLGTTRLAFSTDNNSIVVATMAAASGGIAVGAEFATVGTNTPRGIYFSKDAGLTWQRATISDGGTTPDTGSSNSVIYNPFTQLFYANIRYHGFYSSSDGQNWTRLTAQPGGSLLSLAACPSSPFSANCPLYRAEMTIVPGRAGANAKGEMYVWMVNSSDANEGIFQSLDGGATWTAISTTGIDSCGDGSNNGCGTQQGSYNLTLLAVPNGATATDLYAAAINQFRCNINPVSNPTCAAKPFNNLTHTYGACGTGTTGAFASVHPDQHGIDFVQGKPQIIYFGNDGGVYRTLNGYDVTQKTCNSTSQPWIEFDNLSGTMGSMIQYVWFSQNPADANILLGGTQDNGTMAKNGSSPATSFGYSWQSVNNGDGGFNDINPVSPQEWFVSNPHVSVQQCINGSGISCTANTFNEIVNSSKVGGDSAPFYMAYMLDPQAANHLLVGTCRLWRVDRTSNLATTWPGSSPLTYNLDQFSSAGTATCSASASNTVNAIAAGGPCKGVCNSGTNGTGNGSQVIYVGTNAARVFVTTNADGGTGTWIDRTSGLSNSTGCGGTGCPISGIAIDPADPTGNTAYVTVMGFKTGHVFKTTNAGAAWTNLDGDAATTGLPDNPADAVAIDPNVIGLVYVATDVGVFKSLGDGLWTEVGPSTGSGSLPNVATTALRTFGTGANSHLRVSTYGRGIFDVPVPNTPGFQLVVTPTTATVNVTKTVTLSGTITPFNHYTSAVNIQCTGVPANVTCTPSPTSVATSSGTAQSFTVAVSASVAGTYNFSITAVGTDPAVVTQQQAITLIVVVPQGLSLSAPPQATAPAGSVASTSFNLTSINGFTGPVTLACSDLPAGAGPCTFSPAIPNLTDGGTANVTVNIPTGTAPASSTPYSFTITASSPNSLPASASASLLVTVPPDFKLSVPAQVTFNPGLPATFTAIVSANPIYSGTVTLSCQIPSNINTTNQCTFTDPNSLQSISSVALSATTTSVSVKVSINTVLNATSGNVTILGNGSHPQVVSLTASSSNALQVTDTAVITPFVAKAGQQLSAAVSVQSNYTAASVTMSCAISPAALVGTSTCAVNPSVLLSLTQGTPQTVSLLVNTFGGLAGNATVKVTAKDSSNAAINFTGDPFAYSVTDYSVTAGAAAPILPGGSVAVPITVQPQNGYTGNVAVTCTAPTPLTCFPPTSTAQVTGSSPVIVTATITGPGSTNTTSGGNYSVLISTTDSPIAHPATIAVTVQDYKLTTTDTPGGAAKTSANVTAGLSATFTVNVVAQPGGFSGSVVLDAAAVCGGLPSKTTCTLNGLSSGPVTLQTNTTATLVIQTTAATTAGLRPLNRPGAPILAFWTMLPGVIGAVFVAGRRRKRTLWALLALMFLLLILMIACGGGGGGATTAPPPTPIPGTPAGTSTITLTSTSSSGVTAMTRTAQITLTVQ